MKSASDTQVPQSCDAGSTRTRPTVGSLRIPPSANLNRHLAPEHDVSSPLNSPLMFCEIDSDISATPSPSSAPTSALSAYSTDTTVTSEDLHMLIPVIAVKRSHDGSSSPEMMSKKVRKQTLPDFGSRSIATAQASTAYRHSVGGDNRTLIHSSTFTKRAPAPAQAMRAVESSTFPELSSFRPRPVRPQGLPRISTTPVKPATRRTSAIERDESPEPAETPIYARSLHLVDTEVSIYKKVHGDESSDYSLCLYCFRQHGAFNRITDYGYELCGGDEALDSHYWEPYGDTVDFPER
ncbi:hypothetical protein EK21DRAFT_65423 [Setomelanomma holmii]|uniref:Uncharacterized protein n=1 Tax=Setomelanomma holmii TaxID=210430 RepID=A0A9P4H9Q7_9PLEO|nr:hypothetical protein EK21DRAFT_65423 [Setomelanomma holmii]